LFIVDSPSGINQNQPHPGGKVEEWKIQDHFCGIALFAMLVFGYRSHMLKASFPSE